MNKILISLILCLFTFFIRAQPVDSLDMMIGQMIMIGIGDFEVLDKNAPVFKSLEQGKAGGIILFEKNISSKNSKNNLQSITDYAQNMSAVPLFVSIDQEGGRVNRLKTKYGFPKSVSAQYLGKIDNLDSTRHYAFQTASALVELGINLNYAPILDVNINPQNPVIGKIERSYSSDFSNVAKHASAVIQMHDSLNVVTAVKHFPGHGSSKNDTHLGLTDVSETWQMEEIYPYKVLLDSGLVRIVMTAHIVNRILDSSLLPATLSKKIVTGLLRGFLNYDGVVISDDMQMGAISKEYGLEEAIKLSINAGVDILMFANNVPESEQVTADKLHQIIRSKVENNEIPISRILESYDRIIKLKSEMGFIDPR